MTKWLLRLQIALLALIAPAAARANVSISVLDEKAAQAIFHFVEGCITTDVIALVDLQEIRQIPGNTRESIKFTVTSVRQVSEPANGPGCADDIIQDSFFDSDDPVGNFHPVVMEVHPGLQNARVAGTGSFFDSFHGIQRDMAFDIRWEGHGKVESLHSRDEFEENGEIITSIALLRSRDAVASGMIKECDNEFDGPVDGLCTAADLAAAPNLIPSPSDPTQTDIFHNVFTEMRRPSH